MIKNSKLLKNLYKYFDHLDWCVGMESDFIYVHHSMCTVCLERKNEIAISFEVSCDPTIAANLTQQTIAFANKHKYKVGIYEPYAYVVGDDDIIQQVLFGEDAIEYMETGKLPVEESSPEKSTEDLDAQLKIAIEKQEYEKASQIRDKISKRIKDKVAQRKK